MSIARASVPDLIPFIDLGAQRQSLGRAVDEAILRVLDHGAYIMGPEVARLEGDLSAWHFSLAVNHGSRYPRRRDRLYDRLNSSARKSRKAWIFGARCCRDR